jgi:hypothetical protein
LAYGSHAIEANEPFYLAIFAPGKMPAALSDSRKPLTEFRKLPQTPEQLAPADSPQLVAR